jgi:phage-Barnase-EndoU-ColicinE5/D-RelE like nuclease3/Transposase zinc-ribbon domain
VITIDGYGILHAIKRHGNEPNENQVSLSEEDFLLIEQIVFEADKIENASRYEKNALQFSKLIENEYFTIFEVITITGEKKKF